MGKSKHAKDDSPALESAAQYRKRAKSAHLIQEVHSEQHTIKVAINWPGTGYGIAERVNSIGEALESARSSLKLGYGRDRRYNRVHIIETTTRVTEVRLADAS